MRAYCESVPEMERIPQGREFVKGKVSGRFHKLVAIAIAPRYILSKRGTTAWLLFREKQ